MRVLLLAPPGAGKGTQGKVLADHFGLTHISSGDVLRDNLARGTDLGMRAQEYLSRGDLVPDDMLNGLLREPIQEAVATGGYVLDGFPRTLEQAQATVMNNPVPSATLQCVLFLDVSDQDLVTRLLARRRGSDDTAETIGHRLEVYHRETEPLVAYYRGRGLLHRIDGAQPVADVTRDCIAVLTTLSNGGTPSDRSALSNGATRSDEAEQVVTTRRE